MHILSQRPLTLIKYINFPVLNMFFLLYCWRILWTISFISKYNNKVLKQRKKLVGCNLPQENLIFLKTAVQIKYWNY